MPQIDAQAIGTQRVFAFEASDSRGAEFFGSGQSENLTDSVIEPLGPSLRSGRQREEHQIWECPRNFSFFKASPRGNRPKP